MIAGEVLCDLLPDDGTAGQERFLTLLTNREETWMIAYGFTLAAMVNDILAAHKAGVAIHLYLDRTQSSGTTEAPLVKQLVAAGVEVTIGTSTAGSAYICHDKALVCKAGNLFV